MSGGLDSVSAATAVVADEAMRVRADLQQMLAFNDGLEEFRDLQDEMAPFMTGEFAPGDAGYLYMSLLFADNFTIRNLDPTYGGGAIEPPADPEESVRPHVDYVQSLSVLQRDRFATAAQRIWELTDDLSNATYERQIWLPCQGYEVKDGARNLVLVERRQVVDEVISARWPDGCFRPRTETWELGYVTLAEVRSGLPRLTAWLNNRGARAGLLSLEKVAGDGQHIPLGRASLAPLVVQVRGSGGHPVPGVALSPGEGQPPAAISDDDGLARLYVGPYDVVGPQEVTLAVPEGAAVSFVVQVVADSDGDGCGDEWEQQRGFDPNSAADGGGDYDGDGLDNATEQALGSDPLQADSDGDGHTDGTEHAAGASATDSLSYPGGPTQDADGDGANDAWELQHGLDPHDPSDATRDDDGDGLSNAAEAGLGSDPNAVDSDGDGFSDADEAEAGSDPSDPDSDPQHPGEGEGEGEGEGPEEPPVLGPLHSSWSELELPAPLDLQVLGAAGDRLVGIKGTTWQQRRGERHIIQGVHELWASDDGLTWRRTHAETPWSVRSGYFVEHDGQLRMIGGLWHPDTMGGSVAYNDVWVSADGESWTQVLEATPFSARISPWLLSHAGRIYVMGGIAEDLAVMEDGRRRYRQEVWSSADGAEWVREAEDCPFPPRGSPGLGSFGGRIWVMGGLYAGLEPREQRGMTDLWSSADGRTWTEHEVQAAGAPWLPQFGQRLRVLDGTFWMFAGEDADDTFRGMGFPPQLWRSEDGVRWTILLAGPDYRFLKWTPHVFRGRLWARRHEQDSLWVTRRADGHECPSDWDCDRVSDDEDTCRYTYDPDQANQDGDLRGDACDSDDDNDEVGDEADNCPLAANPEQVDGDRDGAGDACDNCPDFYAPDQTDSDGDGQGDACSGPDPNARPTWPITGTVCYSGPEEGTLRVWATTFDGTAAFGQSLRAGEVAIPWPAGTTSVDFTLQVRNGIYRLEAQLEPSDAPDHWARTAPRGTYDAEPIEVLEGPDGKGRALVLRKPGGGSSGGCAVAAAPLSERPSWSWLLGLALGRRWVFVGQ